MEKIYIIIGVALLSGLIFKLVRSLTKKLFSLAIIIGVVGFLYVKGYWPFQNNKLDINHLTEKYCNSELEEDKAICDCIIKPLSNKLNNKFTPDQLAAMSKSNYTYAFGKGVNSIKVGAKICLVAKGHSDVWKSFTRYVTYTDGKFFDKASELLKKGKELGEEEFKKLKDSKEEIDKKFE